MPKVPMDYSKCSIYKIEHVDDESLVYVGHTTNFDKRKTQHKYSCKNDNHTRYNLKVYQMIRENGGWEKFLMLEVEKYPCADKRAAERRENEVIKEVRASMNTYNSFRTQDEITEYHKEYNKEFYEANKEHVKEYYELHKTKIQEQVKEYRKNNKLKIQEYDKKYYEQNKPKIQEYKKEYRENNKLKIQERKKEYRENNKLKIQEREKEYRDNNKLKIQKKDKDYYEANKHKIQKKKKDYREANKLKLNEKVKCECGCEISKSNLNRHQATTKHLDKMKNI